MKIAKTNEVEIDIDNHIFFDASTPLVSNTETSSELFKICYSPP